MSFVYRYGLKTIPGAKKLAGKNLLYRRIYDQQLERVFREKIRHPDKIVTGPLWNHMAFLAHRATHQILNARAKRKRKIRQDNAERNSAIANFNRPGNTQFIIFPDKAIQFIRSPEVVPDVH